MAAVSLFWDTNMAAVTSCESTRNHAVSIKYSTAPYNKVLFILFRSSKYCLVIKRLCALYSKTMSPIVHSEYHKFILGMLKGPGLKHRSHSTGQRYRSLFYRLVTDPNNSSRSITEFWIVIRARRHFWACLFICSTVTCTCTCHL